MDITIDRSEMPSIAGIAQLGERQTEDLRSRVRSTLTAGIYWIDALLSGPLTWVMGQSLLLRAIYSMKVKLSSGDKKKNTFKYLLWK